MEKKKRIIDVVREFKEKHQQISIFELFDIEDIVIKLRKK